jgi:hypothetical protein
MAAGQRWYGHGRERCAYCRQPGTWTCDWRGENGEQCGRLLCYRHRTSDGGEDRCREHAPVVEQAGTNVRAAAVEVTLRDGS